MQNKTTILLTLFLIISFRVFAQGDLLITPKRIMFTDHKQKDEVNLVNIGNDTAIYSITFVQYNMNENGTFTPITKPDSGQMFADPYLRIFPRKVTLAPREPQVVAIQYRRRPEMEAGEYRSHLYFRAEKINKPLGMEKTNADSTQLDIKLIPIYGISIPVIIRHGEVNAKTTITNLKVELQKDTTQNLVFTINREGNISTYGNLYVDYMPIQGKPYEIGKVTGLGVYTNINKRVVSVKLQKHNGKIYTSGRLKVRYTSSEDEKAEVYSMAEIEIKK